MKILIVFNHPAPYKVALFNGLSAKHDVHVIFERGKAKNRNKAFYNESDFKFQLHKIKGLNLGNENHLSWGVRRHLRKNKYDLIIMNGYSTLTEMIALRYLKKKHIPYAFYINGGIVKKESRLAKKIKTYFISGAKMYFSPATKANEYLTYYGAPQEKIFNYPYSTIYEKDRIQDRTPKDIKTAYWQAKNILANNFTICITSFIKRKNNLSLIRKWVNQPQDNALILVGAGEEENLYRKYINDHSLTNVYILPFAHKALVFEYLKHADNAIYLSNYDIYGHVINEALAHGLNVLTNTHMVAAHQAINDGVNGLIAKDGDDINEKISLLLAKDFFVPARDCAVSIEQSIAKHLEILEQLQCE